MTDPVEKIVADALDAAHIRYTRPERAEPHVPYQPTLDFHLTDLGVYIECCQFYTERKVRQLAGAAEVILIQGRRAAQAFATMLKGSAP